MADPGAHESPRPVLDGARRRRRGAGARRRRSRAPRGRARQDAGQAGARRGFGDAAAQGRLAARARCERSPRSSGRRAAASRRSSAAQPHARGRSPARASTATSRSTARTSTRRVDVRAGPPPRRHGLPEAEPVPDDVDLRQRRWPGSADRPAQRPGRGARRAVAAPVALWDEVTDRLHRAGTGLSGGQQQRLCIARVARGRARGAADGRAVLGARSDRDRCASRS